MFESPMCIWGFKADNLLKVFNHKNNSSEQWKVRMIFETEYFFRIPIGKNDWDVKTNKLERAFMQYSELYNGISFLAFSSTYKSSPSTLSNNETSIILSSNSWFLVHVFFSAI